MVSMGKYKPNIIALSAWTLLHDKASERSPWSIIIFLDGHTLEETQWLHANSNTSYESQIIILIHNYIQLW